MLESAHIISIGAAALTFILIATFITIPVFIYNYRKHGFASKFRIFLLFTFLYYILTAFYLTILPLPDYNAVLPKIKPQLMPFSAERDILINHRKLITKHIGGIMLILKNRALWQVIFNFMLLLPLGFYLRYYFKKGIKHTLIISFLVSLFFEVTQLTGIYGIYKSPYRLFDVDDLILNTSGSILGYYITPFLSIILPDLDQINEKYDYGKPVTYFRRGLSFYIDIIIIDFIQNLIVKNPHLNPLEKGNILQISLFAFYYIVIQYLTKGITLGKKLFKLRVVNDSGDSPSIYSMFIRYSSILVFPLIINILTGINLQETNLKQVLFFTFLIGSLFVILIVIGILRKDKRMYHDIISKTHVINTFNKS